MSDWMLTFLERRRARAAGAAAHRYLTDGEDWPCLYSAKDSRFEIGTRLLRRAHLAGLDDDLLSKTVESALHFGEDPVKEIEAHLALASDFGKAFPLPTALAELEEFEQEALASMVDGDIGTVIDLFEGEQYPPGGGYT